MAKKPLLPPLPDDATNAQREARIAELRALRRARNIKVARRSGFGTLALIVLFAALLWWLLSTLGGRDFLLNRIQWLLPAGTTFTWQSAEGPVAGPMTLHGVRVVYRGCPDVEGKPVKYPNCSQPEITTFTAETIVIDPAIQPLLGKRLRLDAMQVRRATLDVPRSNKPFELPRWPESLPAIKPPLSIRADTIEIDGFKISRAGAPLIDISRVRGGLDAQEDAFMLTHVQVDSDRGVFKAHGHYTPRNNYRTDFTASALLPAPLGSTCPAIGLRAIGTLDKLDVAVSGNAPGRTRALLTLSGGQSNPTWQLSANSEGLDPDLLQGLASTSEPITFNLSARGAGGHANIDAALQRGDFKLVVQPSKVVLEEQRLTFAPLVVDVLGGRITATGSGDFKGDTRGRVEFALNARGLAYGDGDNRIGASADLGIAGTLDAWSAIGTAVLMRGKQRADVKLDGAGDRKALHFKALNVVMPEGRLDATGYLAFNPALKWDVTAKLASFDPGYFLPAWHGAIRGDLKTQGGRNARGGMDIALDATHLGGQLRDRALTGRGNVALTLPATAKDVWTASGDVDLRLGHSNVIARGRIAQNIDVDAKFLPFNLNDALPDAKGTVVGQLTLRGPRNAPNIAADLSGQSLAWKTHRAEHLKVAGRLPWAGGTTGDLRINARGLKAGVALDEVNAHAQGAMENLRLEGDARGPQGALKFAGTALKRGENWQGTLSRLDLSPAKGAAWQLQSAATYAQSGRSWRITPSCFTSTQGGRLCVNADWPNRGVHVEGRGITTALLMPYIPTREDGSRWDVHGEFAVLADVRPVGNSFRGTAHISAPQAGITLDLKNRKTAFNFNALDINGSFDANRWQARLSAGFNGEGKLAADVTAGYDMNAALSGFVDVDTRDLTLMELLSPDIVDPTGHLSGRIQLGGRMGAPALGGNAQLTEFRAELPALGIVLREGQVRMTAQADGNARISGSIKSGDGILNVDGTLGWRGQDTPLQLNVRGKNILVSDTRDLYAVVDPDVLVKFIAGRPLTVTGTVNVPDGRIELERLSNGKTRSSDVVVLDPVDPEATASTALDMNLLLVLGDNVNLKGFGLTGTLGGQLRVRMQPGVETLATGQLNVAGRYRAYGQNLKITRGRLVWTNDPVANPLLDVRAEREIGDVTAGIQVTGRANKPQAVVWSDPATSQSDALAYLTLGRPLSGLDTDEERQVSAASAALTAGGSLLASQLGSRLGLDDAGVLHSRALGGSVLGFGKYVSPKLYVSYGVSLLGTGQVLMLRYLIARGFDIEIETSSRESRGSLNWRKEK
ncbi:translocation/assembly module TamB [Lysobacter sp. HDW10]|uniref:translocation/assembly module TamB domain-containing protein n=1 Tax=Lysobacter sp. HDW10 TaxID=2714936 RepID=UPI00140DB2EA|nr:translocation/assembly module TamB domain-containing protein [Lysobacter sp. HDW10]QIK80749.1 translocation/assembly module TamB [Lysobacter sp. HDW10]